MTLTCGKSSRARVGHFFLCKEADSKYFASHILFISTTQLHHCITKEATIYVNKWACLCFNKALLRKTGDRSDLAQPYFPVEASLPDSLRKDTDND